MKRIILCLLALCVLGGLQWNNIVALAEDVPFSYQFSCEDDNGAFTVTNLEDGFQWSACLDQEEIGGLRLNDKWKKSLSSLFCLTVTDFNGSSVFTNPQAAGAQITLSLQENGMEADFFFPTYNISVRLAMEMADQCLTIRVPFEGIREEGVYGIINLDLCPYLLRGYAHEDGYVFYPDGSGAIARFDRESITRAYEQTWEIYGLDASELDDRKANEESGIYEARLPVFGIKRDQQAALGVVTVGDENAMICYNPKGYILDFNRIFPRLQYRKYYTDIRSDLETYVNLDRQIIPQDYEVQYFFLSGDDANYSGMARQYREYLQQQGKLTKSSLLSQGSIPLNISFFMGIEERQFLNNRFVAMTTFQQVQEILTDLHKSSVDHLVINLKGIGEKGYGYFPDEKTVNGKLGGEKGLHELLAYCAQQQIPCMVQYNLFDVTEERLSRYSSSISYQKNGLPVSDQMEENYLVVPVILQNELGNIWLPYWKRLGTAGIRLERLGNSIMDDYSSKYAATRSQTLEIMQEMFDSLQVAGIFTASEEPNAYLLSDLDYVYDLPVQDSGLLLTDESVPFYQLVLHGQIPYSANSGNAFYDQHQQMLRWIEYGCLPYFELTAEESNLLKFTAYNELFSSQYSQWKEYILQVYQQFDRLTGVYLTPLYSHEKLAEDVYKLTYENGAQVIINYRDMPYDDHGLHVAPKDFAVLYQDDVAQGGNRQ